MDRAAFKSLSEKTLVPITVSIAAMCFGWWFRDREATKDKADEVSVSAAMSKQVTDATQQILAKIDLVNERFAMLDKARGEQVDEAFLALLELNATLIRPHRYK